VNPEAAARKSKIATRLEEKYVPSAEQRADDERLRRELANADMKKFRRHLSEHRLGVWLREEVVASR
jgi:hypothetical protein